MNIEQKEKAILIDKIIFECKVSNVSDDKMIPLDTVFINLACCSIPELKKIAAELNIKS